MNSFIHKRAHEIARYLEKKGEKLSCLKWEEAEFVPAVPWHIADGRTIIYGETHILLSPNGCWFAFRQGRGYVLVERRPAFRWRIPAPRIDYASIPETKTARGKMLNVGFYIRDESKLQEMTDMINVLTSMGHTHSGISVSMGMSRTFIFKFLHRGEGKRRHVGVVNSSYDDLKRYYETVLSAYRSIDSGTN